MKVKVTNGPLAVVRERKIINPLPVLIVRLLIGLAPYYSQTVLWINRRQDYYGYFYPWQLKLWVSVFCLSAHCVCILLPHYFIDTEVIIREGLSFPSATLTPGEQFA